MTLALLGEEVARRVQVGVPEGVVEWKGPALWVRPERLFEVCSFLKEDEALALGFLASVTAVDYIDCFEVVYHLVSLPRNHSLVLKTRLYDRQSPSLPSVTALWQGADFQEREVWDLMGVAFTGHPNLKRILTWDGFPGHPLRKDFLGG
jgi:NADH-quinone oxidoreductase subunit C